jgi:excisionase family DNA binding protein
MMTKKAARFSSRKGDARMKEKTMTTVEVSAALGVSIRHVLTLIYEKKLPAKKVGMVWQIPSAAVQQRLKERERRNG